MIKLHIAGLTALFSVACLADKPVCEKWVESGYEAFVDGTFGNGGQNIYVSKNGILQRIHRSDIADSGYMDIIFCNSHEIDECMPAAVIKSPLNTPHISYLPAKGASSASLVDLNGDGYNDLVIANQFDGHIRDIASYVYFGGQGGFTEKRRIELPVPDPRSVAVGDFNGDGLPDIAFVSKSAILIYYQSKEGFITENIAKIDSRPGIGSIDAGDVDGDGLDDIYARTDNNAPPIIFFGGEDGITGDNILVFPGNGVEGSGWRPKILKIDGKINLFRKVGNKIALYQFNNHELRERTSLACSNAVSATVGDMDNDGATDLVVACANGDNEENSWIYWNNRGIGTNGGFSSELKTPLSTVNARNAAVGDINGDGLNDVFICQGGLKHKASTNCRIFENMGGRKFTVSNKEWKSDNAVDVFISKEAKAGKDAELIIINNLFGIYSGNVPVYIYKGGKQGFSKGNRIELLGFDATTPAICDFNDDGIADVFICNCAENVFEKDHGSYLYWGSKRGFSDKNRQILRAYRSEGVGVGDFRKSGFLDIAVAGFSNPELLIFEGTENGYVNAPKSVLLDPKLKAFKNNNDYHKLTMDMKWSDPRFIFTADLNNDTWLDLVVPQYSGDRTTILWGGAKGFSRQNCSEIPVPGGVCAQAADFNGDGWLDLVIGSFEHPPGGRGNDSYVHIFYGAPEGYSQSRSQMLPARAASSLAIADFNGDNKLDIFVANYMGARERDIDNYLYWGQPDGSFRMNDFKRLFGHSSSGCTAGDFNEDGYVDLAVASHRMDGHHFNSLSIVWWNSASGFSENNVTKLPTIGPHGMPHVDYANIMDRSSEESYVSSAFKMPDGAEFIGISWAGEVPAKTWVKAQVRTSDTKEGLDRAKWIGLRDKGYFDNGKKYQGQPLEGWIQYRLLLGALNGISTPRISSVAVEYKRDSAR